MEPGLWTLGARRPDLDEGAILVPEPNALAADGLEERRPARPDEVKRLGDHPVVGQVRVGSSTVEVAANGDHIDLLLGP